MRLRRPTQPLCLFPSFLFSLPVSRCHSLISLSLFLSRLSLSLSLFLLRAARCRSFGKEKERGRESGKERVSPSVDPATGFYSRMSILQIRYLFRRRNSKCRRDGPIAKIATRELNDKERRRRDYPSGTECPTSATPRSLHYYGEVVAGISSQRERLSSRRAAECFTNNFADVPGGRACKFYQRVDLSPPLFNHPSPSFFPVG